MHTTVFLEEAIDALGVKENELYIDATYGEGGHSNEILHRGGKVLAIDWDGSQVHKAKHKGLTIVEGNYRDIEDIAETYEADKVDGVLFDFGLSMEQIKHGQRGLSFKNLDESLDMRISERLEMTAADFLNTANEQELDEVIKYSEDLDSHNIVHQIMKYRKTKKYRSVGDLKKSINFALENCTARHTHKKEKTYARIFQALRIIVNYEIENIEKGLQGAFEVISTGGKIVVISFHSIEDRIVTRFAREHKKSLEHKKVDVSKLRKIKAFERSATLRVFTKIV